MSKVLQNKSTTSLGKVEFFCLFVACSYTSMEATELSCCLSWVLSESCPKFFEVTNHQYLWKGLSDFVDFCKSLFASCEISVEATIICYFGLALSGIASQPIRLSDVLNVTQKRYEVSS